MNLIKLTRKKLICYEKSSCFRLSQKGYCLFFYKKDKNHGRPHSHLFLQERLARVQGWHAHSHLLATQWHSCALRFRRKHISGMQHAQMPASRIHHIHTSHMVQGHG